MKYAAYFFFIGLEILCFYLIVNYNQEQKAIFINSSNILASSINIKVDQIQEYTRLEKINDSLQIQNGRLIKRFINSKSLNLSYTLDSISLSDSQYELIPVQICNTTFHLKNNYITLCNGSKNGIIQDMGIISLNGIVGKVTAVSDNFAKVMSILHTQTRISAMLKKNSAFGSLRWSGNNPLEMSLEDIPKHVDVAIGDTIVTSGYSTIFPSGINVGIVNKLDKKNNNHVIQVKLFNDPTQFDILYGIKNILAEEQLKLENETL